MPRSAFATSGERRLRILRAALVTGAVLLLLSETASAVGATTPTGPSSFGPGEGVGGPPSVAPATMPSCWTQMVQGSPECGGAQLVYDPADGYVLAQMICLNASAPTVSRAFESCTWKYADGAWSPVVSPNGEQPPALLEAGFVWDGADHEAVLFGGFVFPTAHQTGATWIYHAGNWTNVSSAPRFGGPLLVPQTEAVYDSSDREVLATYQGQIGSSSPVTYAYSYQAGVWTNLSPSVPVPGGLALRPQIADDPPDHGVVFFGGWSNASTVANTTWLFARGVWAAVRSPVTPPALWTPSMTYDALDGYVLLVGGLTRTCTANPCAFSDATWVFGHRQWQNLTAVVQGDVPLEAEGAMTTDPAAGEVLEGFGWNGYNFSSPFSQPIGQPDLYGYVNGTWTEIANPSSSGFPLSLGLVITVVPVVAAAAAAVLYGRARHRRVR